ncbi:MAG: hypothetical protein WA857_22145 [Candidatus Acidiferrum sp.]
MKRGRFGVGMLALLCASLWAVSPAGGHAQMPAGALSFSTAAQLPQ